MASEDRNQSEQDTRRILKSAIEAATAGRREEAYRLLARVLADDPSNVTACLWLAGVTDRPDEARAALEHVEKLNPGHPRLEAARRWAQAQAHPLQGDGSPRSIPTSQDQPKGSIQPDAESSPPARFSPWARSRRLWFGLAGLGLVLLICGIVWVVWVQVDAAQARLSITPTPAPSERLLALQPELNAAVTESRWEDAVAVLQVMRALEPDSPAVMRELARVYYQLGLQLRDQGDLGGALAALDEALALDPMDLTAQRERWLVDSYRRGVSYHQAAHWEGAVETLSLVYRDNPNYLDVAELLYSAYYNLGLSQQAAGDLVGAQVSYQAAVELLPEEPLAREKADEVTRLLRPPTPTPTPPPDSTAASESDQKRVMVDISEQRMYVYDGEELRWKWIVSTGEPGRPTAIGQFAVQSKIPMAYASTWDLDMPHWLGIYWSGPLENGIHALPIQRHTGYKLWDGFLGQRVSYGCVILSEENAKKLYKWAEIGTPVTIQP